MGVRPRYHYIHIYIHHGYLEYYDPKNVLKYQLSTLHRVVFYIFIKNATSSSVLYGLKEHNANLYSNMLGLKEENINNKMLPNLTFFSN